MKKIISTPNAPPAVGPYSQAVRYKDTLYISGQIALNPATGKLERNSVAQQSRRCLENIRMILKTEGASMVNILKCNIFLSSMVCFDQMNEVYKTFFPQDPPARITVACKENYENLDVEIDAVAGL